MRIFVAGGTGTIGRRLVPELRKRYNPVLILTRDPTRSREKLIDSLFRYDDQTAVGVELIEGDPTQPGPWMDRVAGCDAVINLAGENLFNHRWNDDFKALLRDSRIKSTQNMVEAIRRGADVSSPVQVLVNGSAIGYYGPHGDEELTEDSPPGDDFLGRTAVEWEAAAKTAEEIGVRVVLLRTGVVLDRQGGALPRMAFPFKLFVGGKVGSGRQWVSWVHHVDEVGLILFALDNPSVRGPLNATAPQPITNRELSKAIGAALHRPSFFPTPAFMIRAGLGEVAEVVTKGQRVLPKKAQELGYHFKYPEINAALGEIYAR